eukprot:403367529
MDDYVLCESFVHLDDLNPDIRKQVKFLFAIKLSIGIMTAIYVLYNILIHLFHVKQKDKLTTGIYFSILGIFTSKLIRDFDSALPRRSLHGDQMDSNVSLCFQNISDFFYCVGSLLKIFMWIDITAMMKYQKPVRDMTYEHQRRDFNKYERKLLKVLIAFLVIFFIVFTCNTIQLSLVCDYTTDLVITYATIGSVFIAHPICCFLFIRTANKYRSGVWEAQRKYTLKIMIATQLSMFVRILHQYITPEDLVKSSSSESVLQIQLLKLSTFILVQLSMLLVWYYLTFAPDAFSFYNDLDVRKFSIFQSSNQISNDSSQRYNQTSLTQNIIYTLSVQNDRFSIQSNDEVENNYQEEKKINNQSLLKKDYSKSKINFQQANSHLSLNPPSID